MATSYIVITFNEDLQDGDNVTFSMAYDNGTLQGVSSPRSETWRPFRTTSNEVTIGNPTSIVGERSAINYVQALQLDYLWMEFSGGVYQTFSRIGNVVTIRQSIYWSFSVVEEDLPDGVDVEIHNFNNTIFLLESNVLSQASTNPVCTHFKSTYQFNQNVSKYKIGSYSEVILDTPSDSVTLELVRGQSYNIKFTDEDENHIYTNLLTSQVPGVINSSMTTINISSGPQTSVITVSVAFTGVNILEYSLNNTDWQTSNSFTGLAPGTHTLYVRDNFGCSFSMEFVTDSNGIISPYTYYSKSNSIHMAIRETFGDCGPYPNDDNTLSYETFAINPRLAHEETQKYQVCDNPPMEFRSNFSSNTLKVIKENGTTDDIILTQITNNIGRKDSRDGIIYSVGNDKTGLRFNAGNTYDYDTDIATGSYSLNGGLPEYAKVGNWVNMDNVWYQIENIYFDDSNSSEVIVLDGAYESAEETVIVKSIFNRLDYEVFRAVIPMLSYNNTHIQLELIHEDDRFDTITRGSEKICVKTKHNNTVKIEYYNSKNTDIFYAEPMVNIIRMPLIKKSAEHEDESELNKGDASSELIKSMVYGGMELEIGPTTQHFYYKALLALSHKNVAIDDVPHKKNGQVEKEGPIEESNLFTMKAKLLKSNTPFNINSNIIEADIVFNEENIEVPNIIITSGDEFIGY